MFPPLAAQFDSRKTLEPKRDTRPSHPSWTAHARDRGNIAMRFAAEIVFDPQIVAKVVDEARLPVPRVVVGIVDGDDDLKLRRADFPDALDSRQLVGMRRAGSVEVGLFLETAGL